MSAAWSKLSNKLCRLYRDQEVLAAFLKSVAPSVMPASEWDEVERQANQHMVEDHQNSSGSNDEDDESDGESQHSSRDAGSSGRPSAKQRKVATS